MHSFGFRVGLPTDDVVIGVLYNRFTRNAITLGSHASEAAFLSGLVPHPLPSSALKHKNQNCLKMFYLYFGVGN
jgi:hypothetical protein